MDILITSPRAPVTIEWIKIAQRCQHRVHLVDSLHHPIARFMPNTIYHQIPSPKLDNQGWANAISKLIQTVDFVIPTCEDIFYLAQLPLSTEQKNKCLMPPSQLLFDLHHKKNFFQYLNTKVRQPKTQLITHKQDINLDQTHKTILKPVYSRFGRSVIRNVNEKTIKNIQIKENNPWIQQEFIEGTPLCNYAICFQGKLIAHACYRPKYLINQSAASYIEPIEHPICQQFSEQFCQENQFHGQIAFDFIDDGKELWVLECNPRATSGLHQIAEQININHHKKLEKNPHTPPSEQAYRIGISLPLLFTINAIKNRTLSQLIHDYQRAKDVTADLPRYAGALAFSEIIYRAISHKKSLSCASTFDIEYDG